MNTKFPEKKGGWQKGSGVIAICIIHKQEHRFHNRYLLCWVIAGRVGTKDNPGMGLDRERRKEKGKFKSIVTEYGP